MDSLIEAALRDQERRILDATPQQIDGRRYSACRECGGKVRANNRSGFCSKTPACSNAGVQAYRRRTWRKG